MSHRVQNASQSRLVFHRARRGYYYALRFRIFEGIMTTLHELARIDLPGGAQLRVSRWHVDDAPGGVLVAAVGRTIATHSETMAACCCRRPPFLSSGRRWRKRGREVGGDAR